MKLCAVSVDLDEVERYHLIHGLPPGAGSHAVYDLGVPRLEDWARSESIPITWFAVGTDLARRENAQRLEALVRRGDEIGNHTQNHLYDLTRREPEEQAREIESATRAIEIATLVRPTGFRAPGYTVSDGLLSIVQRLGFAYDSSVFPSPPYYAAKAAKLALYRLRGRRSRSVLDTPAVLTAPTRPYRVGQPYFRRGSGLPELPIQVVPGSRLPFIGTSITLAGPEAARLLARLVVGEPLVNLELHGIDALGRGDNLEHLEKVQPDLKLFPQRKLEALSAVVGLLRQQGYSFVRLDEAARLTVPS
jgi:peptidoglycan/xylan/chitin deacetylase (PgdA/CDA1 family)